MTPVPPLNPPTRIGLVALALAGLVFAAPAASAAANAPPHIVDLGTLTGQCCSAATSINDSGDVVGASTVGSANHAFRWHQGRMTDLGTLGGPGGAAADINNAGDVVGSSDTAAGTTHAVLWRDGHVIDLGTLGGDRSYATAVNNRGEVAGFSETANGLSLHPFLWRDGTMTDLGAPAGGYARAYDIDDRGRVVGTSSVDGMNSAAVRWQRGTTTALTTRPGQATATNDHGQVAGFYYGDHAFLWSRGRLVDLPKPAGSIAAQAWGINNHGQVVGDFDTGAVLWQDGRLTVLPSLVGAGGSARHINNRGQIVGYSNTDPMGGNAHAVLWTR